MHKNELTTNRIGFALHGYDDEILTWLEKVKDIFNILGYPLKSVSYDINYNKFQRKSLKSLDRLYLTGQKRKVPIK